MQYQGFLSPSSGKKFVLLTQREYEMCSVWEANHSPTCSKAVSPRTAMEYTLEERVKMGGMASKMARPRLLGTSFSIVRLHLSCGLHCSGYIIFWLRDQIAKFKKKNGVLAEIAKFNAHQIFHCMVFHLPPPMKLDMKPLWVLL